MIIFNNAGALRLTWSKINILFFKCSRDVWNTKCIFIDFMNYNL